MAGKQDLTKIKLGYSGLTDKMFLYRHGVNVSQVLDKRDAEADVFSVLITKLMNGTPKGSTMKVTLGDQNYEVTVKPVGN
jgi:hypothetical protein